MRARPAIGTPVVSVIEGIALLAADPIYAHGSPRRPAPLYLRPADAAPPATRRPPSCHDADGRWRQTHRRAFAVTGPWSARGIRRPSGAARVILCGTHRQAFVLGRVTFDEAEVMTLATVPDQRRKGLARGALDRLPHEGPDGAGRKPRSWRSRPTTSRPARCIRAPDSHRSGGGVATNARAGPAGRCADPAPHHGLGPARLKFDRLAKDAATFRKETVDHRRAPLPYPTTSKHGRAKPPGLNPLPGDTYMTLHKHSSAQPPPWP